LNNINEGRRIGEQTALITVVATPPLSGVGQRPQQHHSDSQLDSEEKEEAADAR
jgi:hypothetical protein